MITPVVFPNRGTLPIVRNDLLSVKTVIASRVNGVNLLNPFLGKTYGIPNRNWVIAMTRVLMPVVARDMPSRVQKAGFNRVGGVATRAYLTGQMTQQGTQQ